MPLTNYSVISNHYALAIFNIGNDNNVLNTILSEMKNFRSILDNNQLLQDVFNNNTIPKQVKLELWGVILSIFNECNHSFHKITNAILHILISNHRCFLLNNIIDDIESLDLKRKSIEKVTVYSSDSVNEEFKAELNKIMEEKVGKKVSIDLIIDKSIIGGIAVKLGSKYLDLSIRGKLKRLSGFILHNFC